MLGIQMPLQSPSPPRVTAKRHTAAAWCMRYCRASASLTEDAPFVVVVDVVRKAAAVVFASQGFGWDAVGVREDMLMAVGGIARTVPY